MADYVISTVRTTPAGYLQVEIVTDRLQRATIAMRYEHSTLAEIEATCDHALAALTARGKPVR